MKKTKPTEEALNDVIRLQNLSTQKIELLIGGECVVFKPKEIKEVSSSFEIPKGVNLVIV